MGAWGALPVIDAAHEKDLRAAVRFLKEAADVLPLDTLSKGVVLLAAGLDILAPVIGEKGALVTLKTMMGRIR
jgi:hypothetical protein